MNFPHFPLFCYLNELHLFSVKAFLYVAHAFLTFFTVSEKTQQARRTAQ